MRGKLLALLAVASALAIALAALWLNREPLLLAMTDLWVVSEPLQKADAIVVLGGSVPFRAVTAAQLVRAGYAPTVVLIRSRSNSLLSGEEGRNRKVLLKEGVPAEAVVAIGNNVTSTRDESLAVRDWINSTRLKTIIIPTEFPYTRRTSWIFHKALSGTMSRVIVYAIKPWGYSRADWWHYQAGRNICEEEFVKYLYYRCRY